MSVTPATVTAAVKSEAERAVPRVVTPPSQAVTLVERGRQLVAELRERSVALLPYMDYTVQRLGRTGIVGLTLVIFSVVFALSTISPLRTEQQDLAAMLQLDGASPGAAAARTPVAQLDGFLRSLPRQSDLPRVTAVLFEQAQAAGIELESGTYELVPAGSTRLARYRINYPVTGSYPAVRKFVDGTLLAMPAVALESFRIERTSIADQTITADLRFVVEVRSGQ